MAAQKQKTLPSVESMIARLEAQLADDPGDLNMSLRLGRAYALAGRFERSAETYRQAIQRHQDVAELHSALGEALVMASDGIVGPERAPRSTRRSRSTPPMRGPASMAGLRCSSAASGRARSILGSA